MDNPKTFENILENLFDGVYLVDPDRRITYWNKGAERMTGFDRNDVIGHLCYENLLQHVDAEGNMLCGTGCPLAATMADGQPREVDVFLHHCSGHRVSVSVRATPIRDQAGKIIGAVEVFSENSTKISALQKVEELTKAVYLDTLTGVGNHLYTVMQLETAYGEFRQHNLPFGVLFIDVDHFKKVNDTYGHLTGDHALRTVASTLAGNLRSFDFVGRWGGEEFLAIITNVDQSNLMQVGEKLRALIEQSSIQTVDGPLRVTVSIGAAMAEPDDTIESLVERADQRMYLSKAEGRNRVSG